MNVTVVIPTYNERDNLPVLIPDVLGQGDYRVLVVDDDSPDGTGAVADALARAHPGRGGRAAPPRAPGASAARMSTRSGKCWRATPTSSARWTPTCRTPPS